MPTINYKITPDEKIINTDLAKALGITDYTKEIRIPGCTTVIGRFKESGGLIYWAWDQGRQGLDFRETRDKAADAGTLAHAMVEADIRGTAQPDLSQYPEEMAIKSSSSFKAYLEWKEQSNLRPVETELHLTSKKYMFGGTIDAVEINNKITLLDWKTSSGIYTDALVQLGGGYSLLWEENFPDLPITGGFHILRFSKEEGDFDHFSRQNLDIAKDAFIHMRILFELDKQLKKRI